jgi:hypothetical protein
VPAKSQVSLAGERRERGIKECTGPPRGRERVSPVGIVGWRVEQGRRVQVVLHPRVITFQFDNWHDNAHEVIPGVPSGGKGHKSERDVRKKYTGPSRGRERVTPTGIFDSPKEQRRGNTVSAPPTIHQYRA